MFDAFFTRITRVSGFSLGLDQLHEFELAEVMGKPHIRLSLCLPICVPIRPQKWIVGCYTDRDHIAALRTGIRQEIGQYLAQAYVEPDKVRSSYSLDPANIYAQKKLNNKITELNYRKSIP